MDKRFSRTALLLGNENIKRLIEARVAVFGLGGVGAYTAEALVRSGIGFIRVVDFDTAKLSNCNRQGESPSWQCVIYDRDFCVDYSS
jgi:tRNA A37 threonylcarbamoyladenosine dehydratase